MLALLPVAGVMLAVGGLSPAEALHRLVWLGAVPGTLALLLGTPVLSMLGALGSALANDTDAEGNALQLEQVQAAGSNGGLLVGAVFTQRPDLFNAVVCQVPLLDMRRYNVLLAGASWMAEYGNPDKPEEWAWISGYSPYQNVKPGVKYPKAFFVTSTRDDRVHPGHARKMAARMLAQEAHTSLALGLLLLFAKPGSASPIRIEPRQYARQAFLITLLNPKAIVFYMAFFPLFIDPTHRPGALTFGLMAATIAVITAIYCVTLCAFADAVAGKLRAHRTIGRWLERAAGSVLIAFGIKLGVN